MSCTVMKTCTAVILGLYVITAVSLIHYHYTSSYNTAIKAGEYTENNRTTASLQNTTAAGPLVASLLKSTTKTSPTKTQNSSTYVKTSKTKSLSGQNIDGQRTASDDKKPASGDNEAYGSDKQTVVSDAKTAKSDTVATSDVIRTDTRNSKPSFNASETHTDSMSDNRSLEEYFAKDHAPTYRHTDLHPTNLTLINIRNFNITINFDICDVEDIAMVVTVTSAVKNRNARDVIRKTWGRPNIPGVNTRLVFILGMPENMTQQEALLDEAMIYKDIVQGDFVDSYRNLSYKTVFGKLWVSRFCEQAEFLVKTDDDWIIDLYETYTLTRRYLSHPSYKSDNFVLCPVRRNFPILRDKKNKWFVSFEELSTAEAKGKKYPPFCSGAFSIFNPGTAKKLAEKASSVKFLHLEDVWVTGYIVAALKIVHLDCMQYWTKERPTFVVKKSVQTPETYYRDYIVGPSDAEYDISYTITKHAQWCFQIKCLNNVYFPNKSLTNDEKIPDKVLVKKLKLKV